MRGLAALVLIFLSSICWAEVDLSEYDLTEEQIKIIRKIEAKDTVSDQVLIKLAKASEKHNERENEYVPEYTLEQLELVRDWAVGGVFRLFAKDLGLTFDYEAYMKDYPVYVDGSPYMAILNFGLATGLEHYPIDIMMTAVSLESSFTKAQYNSPETFYDKYIEAAQELGFDMYITKPCMYAKASQSRYL